MNVSYDFDRCFQFKQHWLRQENLSSHLAYSFDLCFGHFDVVAFFIFGETSYEVIEFERRGVIIHD